MNEVIVINSKEELMEMFREVAKEISSTAAVDNRLYMTPAEFAKDIGMTFNYFDQNILDHPDFGKCVVQIDRKYHIKIKEGRETVQKIMDKYRK